MLPELRPRGADIATDVDSVAVAENVIDNAIRIRELSSDLAGGKDLIEFVRLEAHGYDGLRRRVAAAAEPVGVHAADGAGQAVGSAVKIDSSRFALVRCHDSECSAIGGGDGIAHMSEPLLSLT